MPKYTFRVTKLNNDRRREWDNRDLIVRVKAKNQSEADRKARKLADYKGYQTDATWEFTVKEIDDV